MRSSRNALLAGILSWSLLGPPAAAATPATRDQLLAADPTAPERAAAWNQVLVWDPGTLSAINAGLANPALDPAMVALSGTPLLIAAPLAALPYTYATRGAGPTLELLGTLAAAEAAAGGIGNLLKIGFARPRPYLADATLRTPAGFEDTAAFPSGHAAVSFAWATVLALDEPALTIPAFTLASGIVLSRMYNGVHYPSDVAAGALLGAAAGWAAVAGRKALWPPGR
ncbi:MAG: phosphatase PAP2 family protein [Candidatus Sericytochromatia bacterium]|nr:phosphatase PAP2 family protein [Candidatus Tanganyikabacteria bacterium]